ncbi:MAG: adenylate/guanylate cyclase domain-containing protein [candidate division WOR-3 bacterium]|nr:MAG: adenylate/guanylate cyclase domain-containing protein [candidate division WOR-3 bacterium]
MEPLTKRLHAAILFADIRNFTTIVNILSLHETYTFLNDCFRPIAEIVYTYDGTVDKFIGDAVVNVFGEPVTHPDDPVRAITCALDIQRKVEEINITWRKAFDFLVDIDIGISTGEVLAGTIGHAKKMQHTVIGRNVNLAAELANLCHDYNVNILLDHYTYEKSKNDLNFRNVGEKLILGFTEPIRLYTPTRPPL